MQESLRSDIARTLYCLVLREPFSQSKKLFLENYIEEERRKISQKRNFYALKETNKPKKVKVT